MYQNVQALASIGRAQPIPGWETFLQEGEAFLKAAAGAHARGKEAFTPVILYNITAMAIEKLVMAALMQRGALPCNHTMADLVEALESMVPAEIAGLKEDLLALDRYQEICALDSFLIAPPGMADIPAMLGLAEELRQVVHRLLGLAEEGAL